MTNAVAENTSETAGEDLLDDVDLNLDSLGVHDGPIGQDAMEDAAESAADAAGDAIRPGEIIDAEFTVTDESAAEKIASLETELQKLRDELAVKGDLENQIRKAAQRVERLASQVESAESSVEEAKGDLKSAKERYETGMRELRSLIKDKGRGQQRLPLQGKENDAAPTEMVEAVIDGKTVDSIPMSQPTAGVDADEHAASPISVLSQKQMIKLVGQDVWEAAKNREEPFGLGKAELGILETAELATIGDLEKRMREDAWWHKKLPKLGEKKVAKLIESLRVWRGKFPMPEVVGDVVDSGASESEASV